MSPSLRVKVRRQDYPYLCRIATRYGAEDIEIVGAEPGGRYTVKITGGDGVIECLQSHLNTVGNPKFTDCRRTTEA